jgi:hypothetical protein
MIDLIRASALPSNLMMAASKGSLSVPPPEMLEIMVHLANHNKIFGQQAKFTLASWDEKLSRAAAADPGTPKEVLDYMVSPHNLRPVLLPALLSNPAVSVDALITLAATASRDVCEVMFASERARKSEPLMQALHANPRLVKTEPAPAQIENSAEPVHDAAPETVIEAGSAPVSQKVIAENLPASSSSEATGSDVLAEIHREIQVPGDVLDEGILAYLSEHAQEIANDANKEFQPIGGFYDELIPNVDDILPAPAGESATPAGAAVKKSPIARKPVTSQEQERGSALQKISKLDIKGRIQLAMKGTKEERSLLVRDGTKVVALAVLESPKISDGEVEKIASQKNVLEAVLRAIPIKRRFAKNYAIVRNLVFNPRTPLDLSLTLVKNLLVGDLKHLSGNKEVSETVRKVALRMLKTKTEKK